MIVVAIGAVAAFGMPEIASAAQLTTPVGWAPVQSSSEAIGARCADVLFIGARGSGEPYKDDDGQFVDEGYGAMTQAVRDGVQLELGDDVSVRQYALDYAATPIDALVNDFTRTLRSILSFAGPSVSKFLASADTGANRLTKVLDDSATRCPNEKWVLAGYSQGSLTIHSALLDVKDTHQLAATVLIADPARDSKNVADIPSDFHGTTTAGGVGVVTLAKSIGLLALTAKLNLYSSIGPLPASVRSTVIEVCNDGDVVCDTSHTMPKLGLFDNVVSWARTLAARAYDVHGHYGTDAPSADGIDRTALVSFGIDAADRVIASGAGAPQTSTDTNQIPLDLVGLEPERRQYRPGLAISPVMA